MKKSISRKNVLEEAGVLLVAAILVLTSFVIVPMTVAQKVEHDVGVSEIISPTSGPMQSYSVKVMVKNYGNFSEYTGVEINITKMPGGILEYEMIVDNVYAPLGQEVEVNFPDWVPSETGGYLVTACTLLVDDVPENNCLPIIIHIGTPQLVCSSVNNTALCCGNPAYVADPWPDNVWESSEASILEESGANWLWNKSSGSNDFKGECLCFCTEFNLTCSSVVSAIIKYGADDDISMWLNGHEIGEEHTPDWTKLFVDPVPTDYFVSGENHLVVMVCDINGSFSGGIWCLEIYCANENHPPSVTDINGPTGPSVNAEVNWTFNASDLDGDNIYYFVDWGDNTNTGWIGPQPCSVAVEESHTYTKMGKYIIKAKAKDIYGLEGDWGELSITVPRARIVNTPFLLNLLEWFQDTFPILKYLIKH